jgi:hypothetical protein
LINKDLKNGGVGIGYQAGTSIPSKKSGRYNNGMK